jgi:hypothetical protein
MIRARLAAVLLPTLLCVPAFAGTDLGVITSTPAANAVGASTATEVRVRFDAPLDAGSVTGAVQVYGRWSGVAPGTLTVTGSLLTYRPARPFFPGEMVTVSLAAAISGTGGESLTGGHAFAFWAGSAPGPGNFFLEDVLTTRLPGEGLVQSYGISAGDLDADGAPDFSIPNETSNDVRVMLNDGCGAFAAPVVYDLPPGSVPSSNEGQDYNGDGLMDFATAHIGSGELGLFIGNGDGTYDPPTTHPGGDNARGVAVMDAEGDGDMDIVLAHRTSSNMGLHRNLGDGSFSPVALFEGGVSGETAVTAADADNDGHMDLFIGGYDSDDVSVMVNDGTGAFALTDVEGIGGTNPWMLAPGDVDHDGNVDVATCNAFTSNSGILLGDGAGGLTLDSNPLMGFFVLAVDLGDFDGDGDLDLVGSSLSATSWFCFENDGAGNFISPFQLGASNSASCATLVDVDRDGYVDIVGIDEFDDLIFLYEQAVPNALGVQPASCDATLRLDNLAPSAGYGGLPPHEVAAGDYLFLGVSAQPGASWWLAGGTALEPGLNSAFGIYNLGEPPLVLLSGSVDAKGEALLNVDIPVDSPTGLDVALQVFTNAGGGFTLSNPEVVSLLP